MNKIISVNRVDYEILNLLGHGKGGYSWLFHAAKKWF